MHPLEPYIQAWRDTADDLLDLLPSLADDDWSKPTDLPGWTRARRRRPPGAPRGRAGGPRHADRRRRAPAARSPSSDYTQAGVDARADRSPEELIEELRRSVEARTERLARPARPVGQARHHAGRRRLDLGRPAAQPRHRHLGPRAGHPPGRRSSRQPRLRRRPGHDALVRRRHAVRARQAGRATAGHVRRLAHHRRGAARGRRDRRRRRPGRGSRSPTSRRHPHADQRVVHRARRRPADARPGGRRDRRRRRARSRRARRRWCSRNELEHGRHPRPDRQARGHHRASPAGSGSPPRSSSPGTEPSWWSPPATRRRPARPSRGYAMRSPGRRSTSSRSTSPA